MTIFGIVGSLQSFNGTVVFIGFLLFLVILESFVTNLEIAADHRGMKDLFEKLQRELMMMGIISFIVFIFQTTEPGTHEGPLFLSFEMTHIIVLFMALAFITQAVFLVSYASVSEKRYLAAMRTSSLELLAQYKSAKSDSFRWWWFHHGSSFLPAFPTFRLDIEFRIIERLFISQHRLSHEFNFAHYVNKLFKVYTAELGEVSPYSWFLLACLVAMNYLRISLIDPSAKSSVCMDLSFDPTSVNGTMAAGKRYLSEESQGDTKNTCDTYVLIYAYTIAALLSSFIMITYAAATIYLDRIILRSLTVDRINAPGRYAYEESLVIMIRKDKMLAHGIMNQLISDKIKTKSTMNNSKNNNLTLSSIIAESKEQQLMEAHQDSLSNSSLITNVIGTVTDLLKGPIVKSFDKMSVLEEANLSKIFLFNRPKLFFGAVEAILLLQCFYISMVATQLIPLALISFHNAAWIVGFLIPIGFNFMIIQMLLNKAVLLRAVHTLEREVAGGVCEDAVEEKHAISNLREAVKIKFEEEEIPECEQKTYLYGYFFRYDVKRKNLIDQSDFRKILGDLRIYMSRESFHILWQAVDFDLSGELDWNEIEEIFFPKSKMIPLLEEIIDDDSKDSLPAINQLRKSLHKMLSDQKIPAFDWDVFLHAAFDKYDTDQSGQLDMEELKDMLVSLKVEISAELLMIVFRKFDREENGLVSFNEFFTFFFPSETV